MALQTSAGCNTFDDTATWTAICLHVEVVDRNRVDVPCREHDLHDKTAGLLHPY